MTPKPTVTVTSKAPSGPSSEADEAAPVPTLTVRATTPNRPAAPAKTPAAATEASPLCVPDPTWAARQERNRAAREAQRSNMNIAINTAITTGQLDEAARLQNDMLALEQQWLHEDQLDPEPAC
ncbi:hypothetical protein [Knoellia sinensis]|uniref:hypothetical protein n=1 Tax=Knoellia sinensis TaxID=136100 RepID=UPI0012EB6A5E|nr:hypothetical protein [Knoellia sinensis]